MKALKMYVKLETQSNHKTRLKQGWKSKILFKTIIDWNEDGTRKYFFIAHCNILKALVNSMKAALQYTTVRLYVTTTHRRRHVNVHVHDWMQRYQWG